MLRLLRSWVVPLACLSILGACGDTDEDPSCLWPEIECDGVCVNSANDRSHCGSCGNACEDGEFCIDGACNATCPEGFDLCGEICVDLQTDLEHCGSCDAACEDGEVCESGVCVDEGEACDDGLVRCGEDCVDTQSDDSNCGTCGTVCDDGLSCIEGTCSCGSGESFCGDACIPTEEDPVNCGDCDVVCADLPNIDGTSGCADSACVFTCADGFESCDDDWTTGCETDLTTVENCGACGNDCSAGGNIEEAACVNGTCEIVACAEGFERCDASAGYGCETDLRANPEHCGACGRICDATLPNVNEATCADSACDLVCATGFDNCDDDPFNGCESAVDADVLNCGACGNTCDHFCKDNTCGNIQAIGVGLGFACASLEGGSAYCWGANDYGMVGDGSSTMRLQPTPVVGLTEMKSIAGATPFTCAIGQDDHVYCWGRMPPDTTDSLVPVQIEGLGKAKQVQVGWYHICAIVENGDVYCWGSNNGGQLGDGTTTARSTPVKVNGVSNVVDLGLDGETSCAVQANGELYCWGKNQFGAFADGTTNQSVVPKKIDLSGITKVSAGYGTICAVNGDGEIHCAGWGEFGQLGDGIFQTRNTFVKVDSQLEFADVAIAAYTSCALAKEGTVWCWGLNEMGMMGSPGVESAKPRQVVNITAATSLERGVEEFGTFCALSTGQGMFCWGINNGAFGIDPFSLGFSDTPILIEF